MNFLPEFLASTLVVILVVIAPGPDTTITIKNSLLRSRKDGLATALAISLGNTIYITLGLLGLSAFILNSPLAFSLVHYCGALYLGYLGIQLLIAKKKEYVTGGEHARSDVALSFREGMFTNLSNPKFLILLLAFYAQFIKPGMPLLLQALYGYQFSVLALMWFSTLAILLTTPSIRSRVTPFLHYVERITGVVLIIFAVLAVAVHN